MNLQEYVTLVIKSGIYREKSWYFTAFAIVKESDEERKAVKPGKIVREPFGVYTYTMEGERLQLELSVKESEPIFTKKTQFQVTHDMLASVDKPLTTTFGELIVNLLYLWEAFGERFPYQTGKVKIRDLEKMIAEKLETNPKEGEARDPGKYYVDEVIRFNLGVQFAESLAPIFVQSITRAGILPPPGRLQKRKELLAKYGDKLHDPVVMARFTDELNDFDHAYLKANDPTYGKFMSGKVVGSRAKTWMTQGGEANSFADSMEVVPIVQSLSEGIPLDEAGFVSTANNIRYGSFSRGAETVNGGVTAKGVQRAADSWVIQDAFCGTQLGRLELVSKANLDFFKGRTIRVGGKQVKINAREDIEPYLGQRVELYSPQYCKAPGLQTCKVCAGDILSTFKQGMQIPLMNVSSGILTDSLKKMHNTALKTKRIDLKAVVS